MSSSLQVVFDLGGVLIDWNPRYLYRKLIDDADEMEDFLAQICSPEWILQSDAGRPLSDCVEELAARHPDKASLIRAYRDRWPEMLEGWLDGTVDTLAALKAKGVPLYVLSNWSRETWPRALEAFDFLDWFDGLVVSGLEGVAKPDAEIYRRLEPLGVRLEDAVFIDDRADNIETAEALGMTGIHFTGAAALDRRLEQLGLL